MAKKASTPAGLVMAHLDAFKINREELECELKGNEHRVQVAKNAIAKNEAKIKEFEAWLADHDKPVEREEAIVEREEGVIFEARAPDGTVYRVFEDGSADGFPEGTVLSNSWLSILQYIEGTVIKEQHGGRISDKQADMFLKWKGLNPSDALASWKGLHPSHALTSHLYQLAGLTLDEQTAQ